MSTKKNRTDPNLEPKIEEDLHILLGMANKLYPRFKSQIIEKDDLFQFLCETYLEALVSYDKKPKAIPKRPFVFNYINFILKRTYRGQFKFEHRDVFPSEIVLSPDDHIDDSDTPTSERNPYLFESSFDLNRILSKYSMEDRLIIYYKFYLNKPINQIHLYLPSRKHVTYLHVKKLKQSLKNDPDMIKLLKESNE